MSEQQPEPEYTEQQKAFIREGLGPNPTAEEIAAHLDAQHEEDTHPRNGRWGIPEQAEHAGVHLMLKQIIGIIGDDPDREGLVDTPNRVIQSWAEIFSGYTIDIGEMMTQFSSESYQEMVILEGIEFHSTCEHHMLPFHGKAWVAYVPSVKIVGISKLARLVEAFSRRLQNQERLTMQITEALDDYLDPLGSACVIKAHHMCMGCRGVKQPRAVMTTCSLEGVFKEDPQTRMEFLSFVNGR